MVHICLTSENEGISLERYAIFALACERRPISGCRRDKRQPEIGLRSQAIFAREREFRVKRSRMLDVSFREGAGKSRILVSLWVFKAKSYYFSFLGFHSKE